MITIRYFNPLIIIMWRKGGGRTVEPVEGRGRGVLMRGTIRTVSFLGQARIRIKYLL